MNVQEMVWFEYYFTCIWLKYHAPDPQEFGNLLVILVKSPPSHLFGVYIEFSIYNSKGKEMFELLIASSIFP